MSIEFTVNPIELFEEKKRFLIYIIFTLTINDEIDLHLTSLLLVICILCREGFLFNNNNNTITKDKVPKESSLFDSNFQLLNCTMIKTKTRKKIYSLMIYLINIKILSLYRKNWYHSLSKTIKIYYVLFISINVFYYYKIHWSTTIFLLPKSSIIILNTTHSHTSRCSFIFSNERYNIIPQGRISSYQSNETNRTYVMHQLSKKVYSMMHSI